MIQLNRIQHQVKMEPQKRYNCQECPKSFDRMRYLKIHRESIHQKTGIFHCNKCPKGFSRKVVLRRHMDTVHSKTKDLICLQCGASFVRKDYLDKHIKGKHLQARPFQCSFCPYAAKLKSTINRHVKFIHDDQVKSKNLNALIETVPVSAQMIKLENRGEEYETLIEFQNHEQIIKPEERNNKDLKLENDEQMLNSSKGTETLIVEVNTSKDGMVLVSDNVQKIDGNVDSENLQKLNAKVFNCTQCFFTTSQKILLEAHEKAAHKVQRNLKHKGMKIEEDPLEVKSPNLQLKTLSDGVKITENQCLEAIDVLMKFMKQEGIKPGDKRKLKLYHPKVNEFFKLNQ